MTHRVASLLAVLFCIAAPLHAQDVPAASILLFRPQLALTDSQSFKLQDLAKSQAAAMSKATSGYLRAEADVVDALRSDDLVLRRAAFEKRAKLAIDAEMLRLKAEKDARAVLTAKQQAGYAELIALTTSANDRERGSLWRAIVAPANLVVSSDAPRDSGEVRVSVSPVYVGIYVAGELRGTGRRFLFLPVGKYDLRLAAPGCEARELQLEVTKGQPVIVTEALTCK